MKWTKFNCRILTMARDTSGNSEIAFIQIKESFSAARLQWEKTDYFEITYYCVHYVLGYWICLDDYMWIHAMGSNCVNVSFSFGWFCFSFLDWKLINTSNWIIMRHGHVLNFVQNSDKVWIAREWIFQIEGNVWSVPDSHLIILMHRMCNAFQTLILLIVTICLMGTFFPLATYLFPPLLWLFIKQ